MENNPVDPAARHPGACPSPATSRSRPTTSWRPPCPSTSACTPGGPECRLKGAYLIRCTGCVKDETGNVVEVLCEYDPESKGGDPADGRKVKGATIHWVEAATAADAEVRLYDTLFSDRRPGRDADKNFLECLNPESPAGPHRLQGRAGPGPGRPAGGRKDRHVLPVHAPGLLLPGQPGRQAGPSGLQPQRLFEGQF